MPKLNERLISSFRANCLAWVALCHFLPARHLRELTSVLVDIVSGGKLSLQGLFEEQIIFSSYNFDSWAVKPLPTRDATAEYLQRRIRHLLWQNDGDAQPPSPEIAHDKYVNFRSIEDAVRLGRLDLSNASAALTKVSFGSDTGANALLETVRLFSDSSNLEHLDDVLAKATTILDRVEFFLQAVITKHLGDLCADSNLWNSALHLYERTIEIIDENEHENCDEFLNVLKCFAIQSKASALRIVGGPGEAANYLIGQLQNSGFQDAPLLVLNASHDALVVEILARESLPVKPDERATMLSPPQLLSSHDGSAAISSWLGGDYADAGRRFWALLRRQIALGASSDTRLTKANYARSIFAELGSRLERHHTPELFWMATRLLIESGRSEVAKKINWPGTLINAYVDARLISIVTTHPIQHKDTLLERGNVISDLFATWVIELAPNREDAVAAIIRYLAIQARDGSIDIYSPRNTAGRAFELLTEIFQKRPEFRTYALAEVLDALLFRLRPFEHWKGQANALALAIEYFDAFAPDAADRLVRAVLDLMGKLDPKNDMWIVVRPALNLLMSEAMPNLSKRNPDLGREVVSTILRFGVGQQGEHGRLLFYLEDFDHRSVIDNLFTEELDGIVQDVIAQANKTASNAVYNICALLYGSRISGKRGVEAALSAFMAILTSPDRGVPSMTLSESYKILSLLADRREQIISETKFDKVMFHNKLEKILQLVIAVWERAANKPILFASFSIPFPTKPNSAVIHNWAFASVRFGLSIDKGTEVLLALSNAERNPDLTNAVSFGRAASLGGAEIDTVTTEKIAGESREAFYAALGNRLLQLRTREGTAKLELLVALIDKCLRVGPNGLDSGIFLLANDVDPNSIRKSPEFNNYKMRLERSDDQMMRLSLIPMLLSVAHGRRGQSD